MKLNGSLLLVVAMVLGSLGEGCRSRHTDASNDGAETTAAVPEESPDTAPVAAEATQNAGAPGVEHDSLGFTAWSGAAPPAMRIETRGIAPGPGHLWAPGYYGWNGRHHVWYGGRWYAGRRGYDYVGPSWHNHGGRWGYRPGRWHRH